MSSCWSRSTRLQRPGGIERLPAQVRSAQVGAGAVGESTEGRPACLFRQGTVNCSVCVASAAPLVTATATTSFCWHSSAAPASCAAAPCSQAGERLLPVGT